MLSELSIDFSSYNPNTSNALSLAARRNDVHCVKRLLKKVNPNCIDNRGWTSLHEAADSDSYESLIEILSHPKCRPLAETHEGHTALYLACRRNCSLRVIKALLDHVEDIANYGSTENVTPLHLASAQGRIELIQLLIDYGAIIDVQDFDGDTPLHDAALMMKWEAVNLLLHAGANPMIKNETNMLTPFHLACSKGCYNTVKYIYPFVTNINQLAEDDGTPLMVAVKGGNDEVIRFLLENGADPHLENYAGHIALDIALIIGYASVFKILLEATDINLIDHNIILQACKPHYFKLDIVEALLNHDLGPEFFNFIEPFHVFLENIGGIRPVYLTSAPLNSYLNICEYIYEQSVEKFREFFYLFLMRGVLVNAINVMECPPLVYIHYSMHSACFADVLQILLENDCNVDYCTTASIDHGKYIPDAFLASISSDPDTLPLMIPYSLCEPNLLIEFAYKNGLSKRMSLQTQLQLINMTDEFPEGISVISYFHFVPSLRQCCRLKIRRIIRENHILIPTKQFLEIFQKLPISPLLKKYLQYYF